MNLIRLITISTSLFLILSNRVISAEDKLPPQLSSEKATFEDDNIEAKPTTKVPEKNLTLSLGIAREIEFQFEVGPIHVGDDSLFSVKRVAPNKLRFVATKPGFTDIKIHDVNSRPVVIYYVRVTREDIGQVVSQLEDLLGDIEGIKIKTVGGTVVIDGEIPLPKDLVRIFRVVDAIGKDRDVKKEAVPIKNIATISKVTMDIIAQRIESEINNPEITVRILNNNVVIEGTANSNDDADRNIYIAKTYLPEAVIEKDKDASIQVRMKSEGGIGGQPTIIDFQRIRTPPEPEPGKMIKVVVNYVELNNEYQKSFNFEWRPLANERSQLGLDAITGDFTANLVGTVTSLLPKLITAKDHGHARILKQQTLLIKDGATKDSGIESSVTVFATVTDANGARSLKEIPVQNVTKVRGRVINGTDSIELGIQVNFSALIGVNNGNPAVANNQLQTQVVIKNGDSVALGGNMIDQALAGYNREPSLSGQQGTSGVSGQQQNAPAGTPIFNLKRSKSYQRNKNQYVIFITPEILRTASSGTEDITRKFRLNAGEK